AKIIDWLNSEKIQFRIDSSNSDTHYSRNFIRHEIMSVISKYEPLAVERMTSLANQMQNTWGIVAAQINKWVARSVIKLSVKSFIVKKAALEEGEIAVEGLRAVFEKYGIPAHLKNIENVLKCRNRTGGNFLLPGRWHFQVAKQNVLFAEDSLKKEEFLCVIPVPGTAECRKKGISFTVTELDCECIDITGTDRWSAFVDMDSVGGQTLVYRKIRFGDNFVPLGRNHTTSVLKFLAKQGYSKNIREEAGVVVDGNDRVVWIPGVRMSSDNSVKKTTGRIIKIVSRALSDNI
ncbi:MAG: hypothetical protein GX640_22980, partial [Fibrobacter sp.]|nr:hypothetical protein [Fibrobacter sp.]